MTEELKPCPFCGGEAIESESHNSVYCDDCGVESLEEYSRTKAITAWNNRVDSPEHEELKEDFKQLEADWKEEWNTAEDLRCEVEDLRKELQEANSKLDKTLSKYGDNWYDGFMAAKKVHNTHWDDLDNYNNHEILRMSEHAESEWLDKQDN